MKRSRFSEEQVIGILREGGGAETVKAVCAKHNISEPTYYARKKKYGGLEHRFGRYLHANGKKKAVMVRLLIEPTLENYVSEKVWHPKQKITKRPGGRVELSLPVADIRDIESWVLSLGEFVRVLEPEDLHDAVLTRHKAAASL
jgi:putative transposase